MLHLEVVVRRRGCGLPRPKGWIAPPMPTGQTSQPAQAYREPSMWLPSSTRLDRFVPRGRIAELSAPAEPTACTCVSSRCPGNIPGPKPRTIDGRGRNIYLGRTLVNFAPPSSVSPTYLYPFLSPSLSTPCSLPLLLSIGHVDAEFRPIPRLEEQPPTSPDAYCCALPPHPLPAVETRRY